jgi:hypothetical protein
MVIKVLLADDHSIVRAGLRRIVEESGDMEVVVKPFSWFKKQTRMWPSSIYPCPGWMAWR